MAVCHPSCPLSLVINLSLCTLCNNADLLWVRFIARLKGFTLWICSYKITKWKASHCGPLLVLFVIRVMHVTRKANEISAFALPMMAAVAMWHDGYWITRLQVAITKKTERMSLTSSVGKVPKVKCKNIIMFFGTGIFPPPSEHIVYSITT